MVDHGYHKITSKLWEILGLFVVRKKNTYPISGISVSWANMICTSLLISNPPNSKPDFIVSIF